MNRLINAVVLYCIQHQIISEDKKDWFRYGLEKRLCTLLIVLPCTVISILLSDIHVTVSFLTSFYYLRTRSNGYHANTPFGCLCSSILFNFLFLGIIYPTLSEKCTVLLIAISCVLVFLMAPFNHTNIHLTQEEFFACQRSARIRISLLATLSTVLLSLGVVKIAKGITLGCTLTSLLLSFAYISEWRINIWKKYKIK